MTAQQVRAVQESFWQVEQIIDLATIVFYDRLFELAPQLERLFGGTREEQAAKLAEALRMVVKSLARPESIMPAVRRLGRRLAEYDVQPDSCSLMGETLLWTLDRGLGEAFTPEARDGWAAAYAMLASVMQQAAGRVHFNTAAVA